MSRIQRRPRWTDTEIRKFHARYMAGESSTDLALERGVTPMQIRYAFRSMGLALKERHNPTPPRFSDAEVRAMHARYLGGMSTEDLAREFHCRRETITGSFRRLGLSRRKPGGNFRSPAAGNYANEGDWTGKIPHECIPIYRGGPCAVCDQEVIR